MKDKEDMYAGARQDTHCYICPHFKVFHNFSGCPIVKGHSRHLGLKNLRYHTVPLNLSCFPDSLR